MANIILNNSITINDIVNLMEEDSKYDVADDSDIAGNCLDLSYLNNIKSKKAPPKVPKVFLSNDCIFNCAYCGCRASFEEKSRYCNKPQELAKIAVDAAVKNGHGVFITSAINKNPDYTEELIIETLKSVRNDLQYKGYVHAKIMPGTDPALIEQAGLYADRLSVNIEVARSEGYSKIAKQKNKINIMTPMKQISDLIKERSISKSRHKHNFATSQTTQLMAGSTQEDDRTIMVLSKALYNKFNLKRVYYTSFQYRHPAAGYDLPFTQTPKWRTRRLYQADRLMELYGFTPDDITPETHPNLEFDIDPKISWALRNIHLYPVEINTASYEMLIRIPGIGITYAQKILETRKHCTITHDILRKIGVSLKRSVYFMTCDGKYRGGNVLNSPAIRSFLSDGPEQLQLL